MVLNNSFLLGKIIENQINPSIKAGVTFDDCKWSKSPTINDAMPDTPFYSIYNDTTSSLEVYVYSNVNAFDWEDWQDKGYLKARKIKIFSKIQA